MVGPYSGLSAAPAASSAPTRKRRQSHRRPYTCPNYLRARARVVLQNKNVMCQYRAVGHPIATAVTEGLVELAAGEDRHGPSRIAAAQSVPSTTIRSRRRPRRRAEARGPVAHHASLGQDSQDAWITAALRAEQAELRRHKRYPPRYRFCLVHRGDESVRRVFYGAGGARISSQDGATVRLDATGAIFIHSGVTEQGQGTESVLAQCVASSFGVPIERVRVITGDTDNTPYGGGTWASRAAGIGGETAWQVLTLKPCAPMCSPPRRRSCRGRSDGARYPRRLRGRCRHRARAYGPR